MPRRHRLLALALGFALVGCPTRSKPDLTSGPDARPPDTALRAPAAGDAISTLGDDGKDARSPTTAPQRHRSSVGPIRRSARFRGATMLPHLSGFPRGEPFVAIVTGPEAGGMMPGPGGASFDVMCFLGPTGLRLVGGTGEPGEALWVGADPGGDLGELPFFCIEVPVAGTSRRTTKEIVDEAILKATKNRALARWLRGPDGRGAAPPIIEIGPRRSNEAFGDDFGRWLTRKEGAAP